MKINLMSEIYPDEAQRLLIALRVARAIRDNVSHNINTVTLESEVDARSRYEDYLKAEANLNFMRRIFETGKWT